MLADKIELAISAYHGLNTRQSKAILGLGFSSTLYDIDLSIPGVAKTRGGMEEMTLTGAIASGSLLSGTSVNSLYDHFTPSTNEHNMIFNFGTYIGHVDENGATSVVLSGVSNNETFDYVSFGDLVYCGNGEDDNYVISGTDSRLWGITAPASAPTVATGAAGVLSGDYIYKYAYVNSDSTHISNGSSESSTVSPTSEKVNLSNITASTDSQVDKINIYRTTDGGSTFLYLDQIDNGTTTYEDNTADSALGTSQSPSENYRPAVNFLAIEEWDGVLWGFGENSTLLYRSNTATETVLGEGLPEESFGALNYYNLQSKLYGIKKSPTYNELWVHTSKGLYAIVKTNVIDAPYDVIIRNTEWSSISHKALKNIDGAQFGINQQGKVFAMTGSGNANYESYLIEPTISGEGNLSAYNQAVAVDYSTGSKNQYRITLPQTGQSSPNRMFNSNYRQRVPVVEGGYSFPCWELHRISATAMTTFINSDGDMLLYIGTVDGKIKRIDYGTNDDGEAIDWGISVGWTRTSNSAFQTALLKKILTYMNPLGTYVLNMSTSFDFGNKSGQVYPVPITQSGDLWDTAVWDEAFWGADDPLVEVPLDVQGDYKYVELLFYGNGLDEVLEMHTISLLFNTIEGFRQ